MGNFYSYYETRHYIQYNINQNYTERGGIVETLGVSCGTGKRTTTITGSSMSFSVNPQAFGFSLGSVNWTSSYVAKTIELEYKCNLPENAPHSVTGQIIVDYYVYSTINIIAEIYKCGESKIISQTPVGMAYINGVKRIDTKCVE